MELLPYDFFSMAPNTRAKRINSLSSFLKNKESIVIASITTLLSPLPDPIHITPLNSLAVGDAFDSDQIIESLLQGGYTKEAFVALPGQFAVRGSVMDIFLTSNKDPIRIEYFGFQVESLRTFNAESQITNEKIEKLDLLPSYEFPINEKSSENFNIIK